MKDSPPVKELFELLMSRVEDMDVDLSARVRKLEKKMNAADQPKGN